MTQDETDMIQMQAMTTFQMVKIQLLEEVLVRVCEAANTRFGNRNVKEYISHRQDEELGKCVLEMKSRNPERGEFLAKCFEELKR